VTLKYRLGEASLSAGMHRERVPPHRKKKEKRKKNLG